MTILPSAYLPPISYFKAIIMSAEAPIIDIGEHFIKRSLRNRTDIMTAQGVMSLTIPVKRANSPQSPMLGIEIDNSKRWQHQHWITILSAYKSSTYFDHYAPYIEPLYKREWTNLVEFNTALILVIFKLLRLSDKQLPTASTSYVVATADDLDLRPKGKIESLGGVAEYIQVFSDRLPFAENLSILDLLMCEGTNTLMLLEESPL